MKFFKRFILCRSATKLHDENKSSGRGWFLEKRVRISRRSRASSNADSVSPTVVLSFEENLRQGHLLLACQQLVSREEQLFQEDEITQEEEEKKKLEADYEALLNRVWLALATSLSAEPEEPGLRKAAASCIQLEEERDQRWREAGGRSVPAWRPRECRNKHFGMVQKVVEQRMSETEDVAGADKFSSSLKKDICRTGKRLQQDLLKVVRDVRPCYPEHFDICNVYARLYHQAFSAQLSKISEFGLDVGDAMYLLSWVHDYYPNDVLKHEEVKLHIDCDSLGALLPEEVLQPIEEECLSHREMVVKKWVHAALKKEEELWLSGGMPELMEGYYFTAIAIDVIQFVDSALKETQTILGGVDKAQRILFQLKSFLMSYKMFLVEVVKGKRSNSEAMIKANLVSLAQLREYIVRNDIFSEEMRESCLSLVTDMKECGYTYFSNIIHKNIKKTGYPKLGTEAWLLGGSAEMLDGIEEQLRHFRDLKADCLEEFLARLHVEVIVEYVKQLMKKKLRLKDREQQEKAARRLSEDNDALNTLFTEAGSKKNWWGDILPRISEFLKVQDPETLQLEVVTLARDYPDLSKRQVSALLHLKANLSVEDVKRVKKSLVENRNSLISSHSNGAFFSRVSVK